MKQVAWRGSDDSGSVSMRLLTVSRICLFRQHRDAANYHSHKRITNGYGTKTNAPNASSNPTQKEACWFMMAGRNTEEGRAMKGGAPWTAPVIYS